MMFMRRDFAGESALNFLIRLSRSLSRRVRGFIFYRLCFFDKTSISPVFFDRGARFFNSKQISLGKNVAFGINARIEVHNDTPVFHSKIVIGHGSSFGDNCHIGAFESVNIGSFVLVGSNVLIIDHNHGNSRTELSKDVLISPRYRPLSAKKIIIEDDVWIGDGVMVLPGSHIKRGAVIAANTVVNDVIDEKSIFTGYKT